MWFAGMGISGVSNADGFSGFYIDAGVGTRSVTTTLTDTISSTTSTVDVGKSAGIGSVAAGWNWTPGGGSILAIGIGIFANFGSTNAGEITLAAPGVSLTEQLTEDARYGISFEPGITFHQDTAVYLKLTASWAKFRGSVSVNGVSAGDVANTHSGIGYGAGIKHLVDKKVFVFAEFEQIDFQSKSEALGGGESLTIKPKNTQGLLGIGYQF